jgi:predicted nucleic acid-binding protein
VVTAYFVDSSALVKRYVLETGTSWVRRLTRRNPSTVIYIAHITAVEVTCAVARRRKGKTLTLPHASSIGRRFRQHLDARYTVIEVTPELLDEAMRLQRVIIDRVVSVVTCDPRFPCAGWLLFHANQPIRISDKL